MAGTITGILALAGATLVLLAGVGVVRFHDLYARMHAATKASTLGVALLGAAGMVGIDGGRSKVALAVVLLFVTAPSGAHLIGRIAYRAEGIDIDVAARDELAAAFGAADEPPSDTAPTPDPLDPRDPRDPPDPLER